MYLFHKFRPCSWMTPLFCSCGFLWLWSWPACCICDGQWWTLTSLFYGQMPSLLFHQVNACEHFHRKNPLRRAPMPCIFHNEIDTLYHRNSPSWLLFQGCIIRLGHSGSLVLSSDRKSRLKAESYQSQSSPHTNCLGWYQPQTAPRLPIFTDSYAFHDCGKNWPQNLKLPVKTANI